ncbi:adenylosuccinate synthetase [Solwaraspora sp. WMMD1047]|uniref:adenylosuccinate synthetase n=1 Tax=Solwaraspora sp. WMMD1047 TaxID=3016102 RepID=UPI00241610A4|nr:adenylosuccinate synthetase [Solwaraspora sp. WMMD1047]MDG4827757.1 adenylosuccinate synthetase [Solwaraspora sp. WMMD1047]
MRLTDEHVAVVDLGYGDAGKGTVVDRLCAPDPNPTDGHPGTRSAVAAVVRFNGGAQAGHNVVTADGRHHTFAQFGSGTLHGVPTHLSRFVVVDPLALASEAAHLVGLGVPEPFGLLTVDADALLATPYHRAANQLRERRRGGDRHGSCGMGVGETMAYALAHADAPRVGDVWSPVRLRRLLTAVRDRLTDQLGDLDAPPVDDVLAACTAFGAAVEVVDGAATRRRLLAAGRCVFEGAQGVLLDEWFGWHPYTTWSTTTFDNAATLLAEAGRDALRLGVVRSYTTRHGPGPHVTEDPALAAELPEPHNGTGPWQGAFRVGHFDAPAHAYAVRVAGGVDGLAVTHLDAPGRAPGLRVCTGYAVDDGIRTEITPGQRGDLAYQEGLTALLGRARPARLSRPDDWSAAIGGLLGAPVLLESTGPRAEDKRLSDGRAREPALTAPAG